MAADTLIEWARHPVTGKGATWNIVTGCDLVSPGCTNCYAMKLAGNRLRNIPSRKGLTRPTKSGPVWTGESRFNEEWLTQPLGWKTGRGIFVAAHGDLFADGVTDDQLDRIFAVMALTPQHIYFVLTKRPERMREYLRADDNASNDEPHQPHQRILSAAYDIIGDAGRFSPIAMHLRDMCEASDPPLPLPNVWLGVSVEDQPRAEERIPILLDTPAAIRFISAEPLLGPIDLTRLKREPNDFDRAMPGFASVQAFYLDCLDHAEGVAMPTGHEHWGNFQPAKSLNWIIAGGESGNKARPSHPDWFRQLRDQCASAEVAFFFKQWGSWAPESETSGIHPDACFELSGAEKYPGAAIGIDGRQYRTADEALPPHEFMRKAPKKITGRKIDGLTHDAFPAEVVK